MYNILFYFFRIYSRHLHNLLTITLRRLNWVVSRIQNNFNYDTNYINEVFNYILYISYYYFLYEIYLITG